MASKFATKVIICMLISICIYIPTLIDIYSLEQSTNLNHIPEIVPVEIHTTDFFNSTVENPVCTLLFPSSLLFLFHHKTGTVLARKMHRIILDYCGIILDEHLAIKYKLFRIYLHFWKSTKTATLFDPDGIRLHFWRDPVLTIISGFKYHSYSKEAWSSKHLTARDLHSAAMFFNFSTDPFAIYSTFDNIRMKIWEILLQQKPLIWHNILNEEQQTALNIFPKWHDAELQIRFVIRDMYLYHMNDVLNQISLKQYGDYYGFNIDFDDRKIHKRYNIFRWNKSSEWNWTINKWYRDMFGTQDTNKYGLYFEMMRYLFVVYPEIYRFHLDYFKMEMKHELKMEMWQNDFDHNVNVILDALNLMDSKRNREILKEHDLFDINITEEREKLAKQLKIQDMTQLNHKTNKRVANESKKSHKAYKITKSHVSKTSNNTKYIDELLNMDLNICRLLKHITNLIEYGWTYSKYC